MAFDLVEHKSMNILHVYLAAQREDSQLIYRHPTIDIPSQLLSIALKEDFHAFSDARERSSLALLQVDGPQLRVISVLSRAFGILGPQQETLLTAFDLRRAVNAMQCASYPVVFVDEAFQHPADETVVEFNRNTDLQKAVFLRSILRAVGIAVVFMGTTANTVSFVEAGAGMSSEHGLPRPWATFITELPPTMLKEALELQLTHTMVEAEMPPAVPKDLLAGDLPPTMLKGALDAEQQVNSPAHLVRWLMHFPRANPRYAHLFVATAQKSDAEPVGTVLAAVARRLYHKKSILRTVDGIRAQVMYLLNSISVAKSSALVTAHFARFAAHNEELCMLGKRPMRVGEECNRWAPVPEFPTAAEDPLLAFLLGGPCALHCQLGANNAHPPPFVLHTSQCDHHLSSATALLLVKGHAQYSNRAVDVPISNAKAAHRDGDLLECIAALACVNAARSGGLTGTQAPLFLRHMLTELQAIASAARPSNALDWYDPGQLLQFWPAAEHTIVPYVTRVDVAARGGVGVAWRIYVPATQSVWMG